MAKVTLLRVRLAFPRIWNPEKVNGEGDPKFSCVGIINPNDSKVTDPKAPGYNRNKDGLTNVELLDKVIAETAKAKWPAKGELLAHMQKPEEDRVCFRKWPKRNGDGEVFSGFEGMYFISASGAGRPTILNWDKTPLQEKDGKPYGGCFVDLVLDIWPQENKHGKRINAELKGVRFRGDGPAFTGGAPASADDFDDLAQQDNPVSGEEGDDLAG